MDLRKAYETLGLARGASTEEVEAAYSQLREDLEDRLARVGSPAIAMRYREVRTQFDAARETLLAPANVQEDPLALAFEVLGLSPDASPLDVASAYVALCEEIDREIEDAATEALRRACLEARADVDAAYQRCALSPLRDVAAARSAVSDGSPARYETQMATEPFEAPEAPEAQDPVLRIEPEAPILEPDRRARGRGLRRLSAAFALLALLAGSAAGAAWWLGVDLHGAVDRYLPIALVRGLVAPPALPEALVEARTTAEALRRRVSEERGELQSRVEEARDRAASLEAEWSSADDPAERERMASELDRVRARRELAVEHADLAERHVLSSSEVTGVYGRLELASELVSAGEADRATTLFSDACIKLEAALARLDVVEEAVGARSEAEAGLDAWRVLAASADLAELPAAADGTRVLTSARERMARGELEEAVPELQRAAHHFSAALAEGRKLAAAARAEAEQRAAAEQAASVDVAASDGEPAPARSEPPRAANAPPVSAPPPSLERAAIKLVLVPAGDFLYGCRVGQGSGCPLGEPTGRRLALEAFRIDRTEVRVDEYRACVEAGSCTSPGVDEHCNWPFPERGDHPVNCVDWKQAATYCGWVGKRLPTEAEWEKAARGTDGRAYPWGDEDASCYNAVIADADAGAPGCGLGTTAPVASRAEGRSPFGLFDMAGNVLEWTADDNGSVLRVVRGGSWRGDASPARVFHREQVDVGRRDAGIGFRCAQGPGLYAVSAP